LFLKKHNKKNKKKLTEREDLTPSSPPPQPLSVAAVVPPGMTSPNVAAPPVSPVSSIPAEASAPSAAMPLPDTTQKVASLPHGGGNWREHISLWFGIVGTVTTIISIGLAVYFYQASQIKPLLTIGVHPLKTELQPPDYDKDLAFIYQGKKIDSESITSVQLSIWNAGTRGIHDYDVLDPIRIVMPDGSAILRARVKKASRAICGFECVDDRENYKSGTCRLKWRILEPGDGAVLQIIYAGGARQDPKLEGVVEGQKDGVQVEQYGLALDRTTIIRENIPKGKFGILVILVVITGALVFMALLLQEKTDAAKQLAEARKTAEKQWTELRKRAARRRPVVFVLYAGALVCCLAIVAIMFFSYTPPGPPFGWE
jgi:hypothetical protein